MILHVVQNIIWLFAGSRRNGATASVLAIASAFTA